jgi:hypothetical protein
MMLRVKVDPATREPADLPEFVAGGREWDDFLIDEAAGVAYVTTHRENTVDRVRLEHDGNRDGRTVIAGDPFNETLVGPSAGAWGRAPGERGRVAYFSTDGGTAAPPGGVYRKAKVLRVELPPAGSVSFAPLMSRRTKARPSARQAMALPAALGARSAPYRLLFFGTFLPFERASESPMAIACFLLLTVLPLLPLLSVPALRRSIAFLTSLDADLEYLGIVSLLVRAKRCSTP